MLQTLVTHPQSERGSPIRKFAKYYFAGIAVIARHFGLVVHHVDIGDQDGLGGEAPIESIISWCKLSAEGNPFAIARIEDYVTALLSGAAANFVIDLSSRCQIKRSFGDAGLETKYLREIWQCMQREPDRALAIICGSLGDYDDGDAEATFRRLWHRAVRLLQRPQLSAKLRAVAAELEKYHRLSTAQINELCEDAGRE